MRIQVIQYSSNAIEKDGITFSPLSAPRAIDDFDINIIDLAVNSMWTYTADTVGKIDSCHDLDTLQQMVENKKHAIVVYVLPQNIRYTYDTRFASSKKTKMVKDVLGGVQKHSIDAAIPVGTAMAKIAYEKTETTLCEHKYDADFYFITPINIITSSDKSEKSTTIEIAPQTYATTLAITKANVELKHFISALFEHHERTEIPDWMKDICFGDDAEQKATIEECERQIVAANALINAAEKRLKENAEIKSILYTNGDELVSVVFRILEALLDCDLSTFIDEKKEDFLIKLSQCTFVGEIKGVTSNVRFEHITQTELHYRSYLDRLKEAGISENVKQILIMNPFRTKPLEQRETIHADQIDLAIRNGCLIIETYTLLRLYERFCAKCLTVEKCVEVFAEKKGLLQLADFDDPTGDLEPYKI